MGFHIVEVDGGKITIQDENGNLIDSALGSDLVRRLAVEMVLKPDDLETLRLNEQISETLEAMRQELVLIREILADMAS